MTGPRRGRFITLEGGEGAGKSTQARRLAERLQRAGHDVVATREPGGSPGAEQIRTLLVEGEAGRWDPVTEVLLHFASRRDHLNRTIGPALAAGQWVVCDRFVDSTRAYQGHGLGVELRWIDALAATVVDALHPDLTLMLDVPVEEGLRRAGARGDASRYERMETGLHERIRRGFLQIARNEPGRCAVVDASLEPDRVEQAIWSVVQQRLRWRA